MACLLGIEDEALGQAAAIDYSVNKVGGKPVQYIHICYGTSLTVECVLNKMFYIFYNIINLQQFLKF